MKLAPVSADLLIKTAIAAAVLLGLAYVVKRAAGAAGDAASAIADAANAVNPLNNDNVIYQTANKLTGGNDSNDLGGRIYEFFNPTPVVNPALKTTGGAAHGALYDPYGNITEQW